MVRNYLRLYIIGEWRSSVNPRVQMAMQLIALVLPYERDESGPPAAVLDPTRIFEHTRNTL